jgi:hypothetical protein
LFEEDGCDLTKLGNRTELSLTTGAWTEQHTELARRYLVDSVRVSDPALGERRTASFLLDLPMLQSLSISLWSPVDLTALARLDELRSLRIDFGVGGWRLGDRLQPVDFSGLAKLGHADVMMCRAFESILKSCTFMRSANCRRWGSCAG